MSDTSEDIPLIYLDSNVISDLATNALSTNDIFTLCKCDKACFAFSQYSVWEAIRGEKPAFIAARALVIDRLANIWIPDPIWQRDLGFIQFLTSNEVGLPVKIPFYPSLLALIQNIPGLKKPTGDVNYTASYMACWKISGKDNESLIDVPFKYLEEVRKELTATQHNVLPIEMNLLIAKSVVERYDLSHVDPVAMLCKVATTCNEILNKVCPSMEVEALLSEFRTSGELKNNSTNTYDFFHLWAALPTCDYFVSLDKDAIKAAYFVKNRSVNKAATAIDPRKEAATL